MEKFDFTTNMVATEEMYVFIQVDMPTTVDGVLYSLGADNEWILVSDNDGNDDNGWNK